MTTHISVDDLRQVNATQDLSGPGFQFKVVTLDGAIAADNKKAAGVLWNGGPSGSFVSVAYEGIAKAYMGAAVATVGFPLKATTSGWLVACASGDTSIGRLDDTIAASGDIARVMIDFQSFGYFGG